MVRHVQDVSSETFGGWTVSAAAIDISTGVSLAKKQFSVTSGHGDPQGIRNLSEWFIGLYLIHSTPRGIEAKQLERFLGVNYRTAVKLITWFEGKEERRKLLFDLYIGPNDPAEFKAREAIKRDRSLIAKQKGKSL